MAQSQMVDHRPWRGFHREVEPRRFFSYSQRFHGAHLDGK